MRNYIVDLIRCAIPMAHMYTIPVALQIVHTTQSCNISGNMKNYII